MSAVPMMNSDRRQRVRYQVSFPVSLATIDSTLDGQAINPGRASGPIPRASWRR